MSHCWQFPHTQGIPEDCKPSLYTGEAGLPVPAAAAHFPLVEIFNNQKGTGWPGVVTPVYNPSAQEAEATGSQVPVQPGLHSKTPS